MEACVRTYSEGNLEDCQEKGAVEDQVEDLGLLSLQDDHLSERIDK